MDGADVCGTSSRASRRPPNVTCGAAILDPRWRRRKWHQPGLGASFSNPIEGEVQNGDPSASGGHLGWPHLRNRKWGHPRWPPEAEGPPFCTSPSMGIEKLALYYLLETLRYLVAIIGHRDFLGYEERVNISVKYFTSKISGIFTHLNNILYWTSWKDVNPMHQECVRKKPKQSCS